MFDTKIMVSAGIAVIIGLILYDMFVKKAVGKFESAEENDFDFEGE